MDNLVVRTACAVLLDRGATTLRFNFRGVGASAGRHDDGNGEVDDLRAALDHLAARHGDGPLWAVGYSFGAATILRLREETAALRRVTGVLLVAPPLSVYAFGDPAVLRDRTCVAVIGGDDAFTAGAHRATLRGWCGDAVHCIAGAGHDLATGRSCDPLRLALEAALDDLAS